MTECIKPIGIGKNMVTGEYYDMPCKKWNCPVCSKVLKNKLLDRVHRGFHGEHVRFMTLTLRTDQQDLDIMKCWNRFRTSLRGKIPGKLKFFLVKEFTKKGTRHLHVLINEYIDQRVIRDLWLKATKGTSYIVWIEDAKNIKNPAGYATKYLTKNLHDKHEYGRYERRYAFSSHEEFRPIKQDKDTSQCEVHEFEPHFNYHSKYWQEWYNKMQQAYGTPFIRWIGTETCIFHKKIIKLNEDMLLY